MFFVLVNYWPTLYSFLRMITQNKGKKTPCLSRYWLCKRPWSDKVIVLFSGVTGLRQDGNQIGWVLLFNRMFLAMLAALLDGIVGLLFNNHWLNMMKLAQTFIFHSKLTVIILVVQDFFSSSTTIRSKCVGLFVQYFQKLTMLSALAPCV